MLFPQIKTFHFYLRKSPPLPCDFWVASGTWRNVIICAYLFSLSYRAHGLNSNTFLNSSNRFVSLLHSRFFLCHAMLPPKKRLHITEPHSFPFVFAVCLHSIEQTNQIITKCEWSKISLEKACRANSEGFLGFLAFVWHLTHATKNGLCSRATITMDKKKVNESPKYKCFMCSSLCSANERIYIFSGNV